MSNWPSPLEAKVLQIILQHGWGYGLALSKAAGIKRGSIYVILGRLEDKGLVNSWEEEPPIDYVGIPRRYYQATKQGRKFAGILLD